MCNYQLTEWHDPNKPIERRGFYGTYQEYCADEVARLLASEVPARIYSRMCNGHVQIAVFTEYDDETED